MNPSQPLKFLFDQAVGAHKSGNLAQAEQLYRRILAAAPATFMVQHLLGVVLAQTGRNEQALDPIQKALQLKPDFADAWLNYGNVLRALGRPKDAHAAFDKACALNPTHADALFNRGTTRLELGEYVMALADFDKLISLKPDAIDAWSNRGLALERLGRFREALASYDRILTLSPGNPQGFNQRGVALWFLNRRDEALTSFERALSLRPDFVEAWVNLANALRHVQRFDQALAACDRALALAPNYVPALGHRGLVLWEMKRLDDAFATFQQALALQPSNITILNDCAVTLRTMKRFDEALVLYDRALALKPDFADAVFNRANILSDLNRLEDALAGYEHTLEIKPAHRHALTSLADALVNLCEWPRVENIRTRLEAAADTAIISPLVPMAYGIAPDLQLRFTRNFLADRVPSSLPRLAQPSRPQTGKIRLAYLSADFNRHPVAYQIAGVIERHDRSRFEVIGISFGRDDSSAIRSRLMKGFDAFHDVQGWNSRAIAELVHSLGVDIAIDLSGYTQGSRAEILAHRPANIQVNYLGYPGTMAADFIDYVIGDAIVLPQTLQPFYTEKIIHLPDTFWPADSTRPIGPTPSRTQAGLPDTGFVFCSFNKHAKITEQFFDIWMRLLAGVPGSVLWLKNARDSVRETLRREAVARGIDPARLIFATPVDDDAAYLARQRLADLVLDTLPYNAHATASDALWAGVPVLTCVGEAFPGRVAASLLNALGLPELITHTLEDYEALALKLAREPVLLQSLRTKLEQNRLTAPLFDTERFTRNIEAAFMAMTQ